MENTSDEIDKDRYTIIKIDDVDNYKCVLCDFYTVYKNSLLRHFNKKNLCNESKEYKCITCNKNFYKKQHLINHLNKKNKCKLNIENSSNEKIDDNKNLDDNILLLNHYSSLLLEKYNIDKINQLDSYKYKLEFEILYNSLFVYKILDNNIQSKFNLLMDITNFDRLEFILNKIITYKNEYINFIINYYKILFNRIDLIIYDKLKSEYLLKLKLFFDNEKIDIENNTLDNNIENNTLDNNIENNILDNNIENNILDNNIENNILDNNIENNTLDNNIFSDNIQESFNNENNIIIDKKYKTINPIIEIKKQFVNSRPYQTNLRNNCLLKFNAKCIISGRDELRLLQACHIKPDNICSYEEKIDINNIILLWIDLHIFLDDYLITIDSITNKVKINDKETDTNFIREYNNKYIENINNGMIKYLDWHNKKYDEVYNNYKI